MLDKFTMRQFVWATAVFTSLISSAVSICKTTIRVRTPGRYSLQIPDDSRYCEWTIITNLAHSEIYLSGSGFKHCSGCECESIEVLTLYPRMLLRKLCGESSSEVVPVDSNGETHILVRYSSKPGLGNKRRYLYYKGYSKDPGSHDHYNDDDKEPNHGRRSVITTTAIGILLALVILVGVLACGACLVHCLKPERYLRRHRHQHQQSSTTQTPDALDLPKLPHLPNYYDNEGAILPPYLETVGTDGTVIHPPSYYDCPPPYSILDTSDTLETTGETRARDRVNQASM